MASDTPKLRAGLEIHQQLDTSEKLFCHCPAGVYQKEGQCDAELIRQKLSCNPCITGKREQNGFLFVLCGVQKDGPY